jgi:hypothetical protein
MVLNKIFFESQKSSLAGKDKNCFVGLVAPPLIDSIWTILISINTKDVDGLGDKEQIYTKFWKEIFGVYIHRPKDDQKDREYQTTLELLKSNSKILSPFLNLWPDYSKENLKADKEATVWVTKSQLLYIVTEYIDKALCNGHFVFNEESAPKLTDEIIKWYQKQQHFIKLDPFKIDLKQYRPLFNKKRHISIK